MHPKIQNIKQRLHTINQKGMGPKFMAYYASMPLPVLKKINGLRI